MAHLTKFDRSYIRYLLAVMVCVWPSLVCARQVVITTTDGRDFTGDLVREEPLGVTIKISGIDVFLEREKISQIDYPLTLEEQFASRRAELDETDVNGWYSLAFWLFENKSYELARQELDQLLKHHPNDARVSRLSNIVDARIKLLNKPKEALPDSGSPDRPPSTLGSAANPQPRVQDARWLTKDQINMIKVWEISLSEKPNVIVPREVIHELFERYRGDERVPKGKKAQSDFISMPGYQQLEKMFEITAREFYSQVRIKGNPPALREFRSKIHQRYVLNYCATSRCHGGGQVAGPSLIRSQPASEQTVYTNFFILHSGDAAAGRLIDRHDPHRSLLIQYGLPTADALASHPDVPGWRATFSDKQDKRLLAIEAWIASLYPDPDYQISYGSPSGPSDIPPRDQSTSRGP